LREAVLIHLGRIFRHLYIKLIKILATTGAWSANGLARIGGVWREPNNQSNSPHQTIHTFVVVKGDRGKQPSEPFDQPAREDQRLKCQHTRIEALDYYEEGKHVLSLLDDNTQGKQEQMKKIEEIIASLSGRVKS
jgi:hypothetical protein